MRMTVKNPANLCYEKFANFLENIFIPPFALTALIYLLVTVTLCYYFRISFELFSTIIILTYEPHTF